jgi:hypothetical protein
VLEVSMSNGTPESLEIDEGVTLTDNAIAHVLDLGANYWFRSGTGTTRRRRTSFATTAGIRR